ncbi:MAG: hypothetical protein ACKPER_06470, partial [Dolichospermum sp.]
AFIATNLESVIGATLQSKYAWLTNEVVNIFNTFIGAISAMIMALIYQSIFVYLLTKIQISVGWVYSRQPNEIILFL